MHQHDDSRRDALLEEARQAIKTVVATMEAITMPVLINLDLTMAQFKGLRVLSSHEGITVGRLGHELGVGMPTASLLVDRLVQLDLANRSVDPNDRRRAIVRLSPAGAELVARLRQGGPSLMGRVLGLMETEELATLVDGLHALAHAAAQTAQATVSTSPEAARITSQAPAERPAQSGARA